MIPGPVTQVRHHPLDFIRGVALVGVLLCNLLVGLSKPYDWALLWDKNVFPFPGAVDIAAEWLVDTLLRGKSVTLFTMLFAIGLCIQRDHWVGPGGRWLAHAGRRLAALLAFGALHIWLLWWGDVLHAYAVAGSVILLFLGRGNRTVAAWCLGGFAVLVGLSLAEWRDLLPAQPPAVSPAEIAAIQRDIAAKVAGYSQPGWRDVMHYRLQDWQKIVPFDIGLLPIYVCTGLLGVCIWRTGVLQQPERHRRAIVHVTAVALPLGLFLALIADLQMLAFDLLRSHWEVWRWFHALSRATQPLAGPVLALGYGGALLLLSQNSRAASRLKPFNQFGRMAFTNYILQSVICVTLFEGWGLGLYGKLSPSVVVCLGLLIVAVQLLLSTLWLRQFHFGPLEWVWRCVTYWRRVPLVRAVVAG